MQSAIHQKHIPYANQDIWWAGWSLVVLCCLQMLNLLDEPGAFPALIGWRSATSKAREFQAYPGDAN